LPLTVRGAESSPAGDIPREREEIPMKANWTHFCLVAAALVQPGWALADDAENQGNASDKKADQKQNQKSDTAAGQKQQSDEHKDRRQLKVFELEHRDPQQLAQIISLQWRSHGVLRGQPGGLSGQVGGPPGIGGFGLTMPSNPDEPAIAFDAEEKLLFVRANKDQLAKIEKLVDALDVPQEKLSQQDFAGLHLIPIRQDKAPQVTKVLADLQIPSQTMTMGKAVLVVVRGDDKDVNHVDQVKEVIGKLHADEFKTAEKEDAEQSQK
jgi:hypothetical protein